MKVLIPIAQGIEEMEAVILMDLLVRAGFQVHMQSINEELEIKASRGVILKASSTIDNSTEWDLILLPGGMPGATHLADSLILRNILTRHVSQGKYYGAICASPAVVLQPWGLLPEGNVTCHPNFKTALPYWGSETSVLNNKCFTSQGPGSAFELALLIIETLKGTEARQQVQAPLCLPFDEQEINESDY